MSATDRFVLSKALDWQAEGRHVALATVIETWGSAPQPVGSQLVIDEAGNFLGSVSGGCVEGAVVDVADGILRGGEPQLVSFGIADAEAWEVGLPCGGEIDVFVERFD